MLEDIDMAAISMTHAVELLVFRGVWGIRFE